MNSRLAIAGNTIIRFERMGKRASLEFVKITVLDKVTQKTKERLFDASVLGDNDQRVASALTAAIGQMIGAVAYDATLSKDYTPSAREAQALRLLALA
jgi:hypothetical protein